MAAIVRRQLRLRVNVLSSLKLNFKYKLQEHMNLLYNRYKLRNDIDTFREDYLRFGQKITLNKSEKICVEVDM